MRLVEVDAELEPLIPAFLARRREDARKVRDAAVAGDFETARSLGHQMKGVGAGYGFQPITDLGAAVEAAAKSHDAARLVDLARALSEYLNDLEIRYK
jgi:HPt (histidine-containing phosphotransfer) domain-containing protein